MKKFTYRQSSTLAVTRSPGVGATGSITPFNQQHESLWRYQLKTKTNKTFKKLKVTLSIFRYLTHEEDCAKCLDV